MTMITVVRKSNLVTDADVQAMVRACATQVRYHAAPVWGLHPIPVVQIADEKLAPPGSWVLAILDNADQAGDLGWHTEDQGDVIYGRVFVKPCFDAGAKALSGEYAVSSVLSHEVLETLVDPHCRGWENDDQGQMWAREVCDPVENFTYNINVHGVGAVAVSDFVTPAWFDAAAGPGETLDWLGKATAPFTIAQGGYAVKFANGKEQQVWADGYPDWKKATKQTDLSRMARRTKSDS